MDTFLPPSHFLSAHLLLKGPVVPMDSSLSIEDAVATLSSARLAPRAHQTMFKSVHHLATRIGGYVQAQVGSKRRRKGGLFRRNSSSSKKKLKKDRRRSHFGRSKAQSERQMEEPRSLAEAQPEVSLDTAVALFQKVVESVAAFVTTFAKTDRFVFHLASMRRMFLDLHAIGVQLDHVVALGGLEELLRQDGYMWETQLEQDRDEEETQLSLRAAKNALPFARNMMPHEPMEALTLLKFEIDFFKPGNSVKHVASMKKVFFSVVRSSNGRVARIPNWYIPAYTVNYSREKAMAGSVGTAHCGIWVDRKPPGGKKPEKDEEGGEQKPTTYKVVVKRITIHADAIELFRQEVEAWFGMDHPNVLKLYGASHCSRPALLVCEDASNGPLVNYLTRQRQLYAEKRRHADQLAQQWSYHNQRHALWSLFLQAAQGLKYLHEERKLVHSNLKSDNILVTADGHVKLADFGQGMLALQNLAVQDKNFRELGWRAPNCWQGKKLLRRPAFQDDIYSFGLCVLDVLVPSRSSLAPADASKHVGDEGFNPLEKSVLELIHDERHRKLIEGMCKPKPEDRLTLKKVISHMEEMCNAAAQEPADSSDCCIL